MGESYIGIKNTLYVVEATVRNKSIIRAFVALFSPLLGAVMLLDRFSWRTAARPTRMEVCLGCIRTGIILDRCWLSPAGAAPGAEAFDASSGAQQWAIY